MGQVFKAHDTRLNRDVALKVLPDSFAANADRLARFTREAQTLASLNHPHIAAIYGLEESAGVRALVMELIEGEDLSERIARGPIPVDDALPIAKQIVEALEAAHEQGIIHRDLKPANIKVREDGSVKVLDFGLAKAMESGSGTGDRGSASLSPTLSIHATMAGVILGTAAYMSPEQAKGRAVDKRSDIWAFGAVLYEMLTGRKAFDGEDITEMIGAVVKLAPDWSALPANLPPHIVTLIQRCLEKDRKSRIGDMAVARFLLEGGVTSVAPSGSAPVVIPRSPAWVRAAPWALAGIFLVAALEVSFLHFRESLPAAPSIQFQIAPPPGSSIDQFRMSPDGRHLVFVASGGGKRQIWVRAFDSINAVSLAGTEGATYPFWSPDSREIAFFAQGKLKKISAAGGPTVNLSDTVNGRGGTWSPDGVILFARDAFGGLYRVTADGGGTPVAVTTVAAANEGDRFPEFLPDGHRFLFLRNTAKEGGLYVGDLTSSALVHLLPDVTNAGYVPGQGERTGGGFLFFRRDNTLMAQAFDPERLQLSGVVMPIAEQVAVSGNVGYGAYAVSPTGTIAFRPGLRGGTRQMVWLDRAGQRLGTVSKPDQIANPVLSPDEKVVAFTIGDATAGAADLWLQNLETGVLSRFTVGIGANDWPRWSPDGTSLVFVGQTSVSTYEIRMLSATGGGGRPNVLLQGPYNSISVTDWSRNGDILFSSRGEKTRDDLWVLPLAGDRRASVLMQTPADERAAVFSPGGDWIAYTSDESGETEIYVQHFPLNGSKFQISSGGGNSPRWSRDGRELFYVGRATGGTMMSVPVTAGATFQRGQARPLFTGDGRDGRIQLAGSFQTSADGKRFLATIVEGETQAPPVIVWTNWTATLGRPAR